MPFEMKIEETQLNFRILQCCASHRAAILRSPEFHGKGAFMVLGQSCSMGISSLPIVSAVTEL